MSLCSCIFCTLCWTRRGGMFLCEECVYFVPKLALATWVESAQGGIGSCVMWTCRCAGFAWYLGLARTVYIHRIWPYNWWCPRQNYRICTVYKYIYIYIYSSGLNAKAKFHYRSLSYAWYRCRLSFTLLRLFPSKGGCATTLCKDLPSATFSILALL
jgi:hypothetical protein